MVFTSAVSSLRVASCPFPSKPPALGTWQEFLAPLSSSTSSSPPPASPRQGQPAQPKIATANKEMSSLGLLSSAGAHFFQLGFKLRNTSVCLVSALCQHFCSACSGAAGRLVSSVGKTSRNNSISFFSPFHLQSGNIFSPHSPGGFGAKRSEWRWKRSRVYQPVPTLSPFYMPYTQGKGQPMRTIRRTELEVRIRQRMSLR